MLTRWRTRLASLFGRTRLERELDVELQYHLDMLTEQNIRAGMSADDARRAARRMFGPVDTVKDDVRDTWLSRFAEVLVQDVRYGVRGMQRSRGFALAVVATMALGIGANTAIFSVVNGVLLRPLPYRDGDHLVVLHQASPREATQDLGFSAKDIADYRQSRSVSDVVEFHNMWFVLLGRSEPERVSTEVVSANFFDVLGVEPLYGRTFVPADDRPGAPAVLVLSYRYWQRSFHSDPLIVGSVFRMNDRPHTVIGVMPPLPDYPEAVDVYMPTSACPFRSQPKMADDRTMRMSNAMARIRSDVRMSKAQADLSITAAQMAQAHPHDYPADGLQVTTTLLADQLTHAFKPTLLILLATAGFVLLIVCTSIANLFIARMAGREQEMALRGALGATRGRLLRQLLTESVLLATAGGVCGLGVASWSMQMLVAFAARFTTRAAEITIDRNVLLFALVVSVATGLVFGAAPVLTRREHTAQALRGGDRSTDDRQLLRRALIVGQVAISFMLLIAAGLTLRSVMKLQGVDPGYRTDHILTMRVALNFTKYHENPDIQRFWQQFEQRLRALPGTTEGGGGGTFPLNTRPLSNSTVQIDGRPNTPGETPPRVDVHIVTAGYFRTIGQPILSGRGFTNADMARTPDRQVVIVNESMARHFWRGEDPIGRRLSGDGGKTWATVVGVAGDARQQLSTAATDVAYVPRTEDTGMLTMNWLVRTGLPQQTMEAQIKRMVRDLDPDQPIDQFRMFDDVRNETLEPPRLTATLIGVFALIALAITAAGLAGVIAFWVNQRTQEFGVRMALGAGRIGVLRMVLRQALSLVAIGLVIGMAGALVLTRWIGSLLFEVQPTDGITYLAVATVILMVTVLACLLPARRAASVDPLVALRAL